MVREGAVRLEIEADEPAWETFEDRGQRNARHPVPPVCCDGQVGERGDVDDAEEVVDVSVEDVDRLDRAPNLRTRLFGGGDSFDLLETRVFAHGSGAREAELQPVVVGRVV